MDDTDGWDLAVPASRARSAAGVKPAWIPLPAAGTALIYASRKSDLGLPAPRGKMLLLHAKGAARTSLSPKKPPQALLQLSISLPEAPDAE